ncbi:glucan endo-1,3-beta-glucosidase 8-like [Dendrobium catenatum]|uniref:Glucan endo-1,3-beta-glucosidase 8 n=1 Tax=Dendrobium catenatum TaxID=906689 RepID=A0A2I0WXB3_9ASPA|nr:glucan endo-1,3-beta-glucosidase 8-like [Dendrobium catenatum]PKU80296.1 Glucan endo-1,3-beta-glucosidase 8 [Dendrobium catenatum]
MASPRQVVVFWATALLAAATFFLSGNASLGVNWGTITYHRLPPKTVARLLHDNGIKRVKLFDVDPYTMETLSNTDIQVMIAVNNLLLAAMNDYATAKAWVNANVTHYRTHSKVNIKYVAVGNEPFLKDYKDRFTNVTLPALKNIQKALDEAGLGEEIKATIPINADIYYSPWYNPVPSAGKWRDDVAGLMSDIVKYYNQTGAPFTVNIYPFFSLYIDANFPSDFAFFDGKAKPVVDGDLIYTNVFDANYDTLLAALKSEGCGDVPIIVGEVGWPTDGDLHANVSIAERFYKGITQKIAKKTGTPQRPKEDIEVYLFGLFDEEAKSILPGPFERSWGIFSTDGKPKFPVDLSGGGVAGKAAVAAVEVNYLAKKWCVLNKEAKQAKNESRVSANMDYACGHGADCMPLSYGSSCSGMDLEMQASYVFNSYFQALGQGTGTCVFDGLAKETTKDYSRGSCKFEIGIKAYNLGEVEAPAPAPVEQDEDSPAKVHGKHAHVGNEASEGRRRSMWKVGSVIMAFVLAGFLLD